MNGVQDLPLSLNRYIYALDNPTSYDDPSGHMFTHLVGGGNYGTPPPPPTSPPTPPPAPSAPVITQPSPQPQSGVSSVNNQVMIRSTATSPNTHSSTSTTVTPRPTTPKSSSPPEFWSWAILTHPLEFGLFAVGVLSTLIGPQISLIAASILTTALAAASLYSNYVTLGEDWVHHANLIKWVADFVRAAGDMFNTVWAFSNILQKAGIIGSGIIQGVLDFFSGGDVSLSESTYGVIALGIGWTAIMLSATAEFVQKFGTFPAY